MLKRITLLGLLALFMFSFTAEAGYYKEKFTKDIPENDPLRADTEKDCLTDAEAKAYLETYFGITVNNTPKPGTKDNPGTYTNEVPKAVTDGTLKTGDVIILEVNDYWRGGKGARDANWHPDSVSTLFDQIKFGIKKILSVKNFVNTPTGKIYGINMTTNRFFFAQLNDARKNKSFSDDFAGGWYKEWSSAKEYSKNETAGWDELQPSYDILQNGDPQAAPHDCDSSVELNHFTVLAKDKNAKGETEPVTVFIYIPNKIDKDSTSSTYAVPYNFFYKATLTGTLGTVTANKMYKANLKWDTSFDKNSSLLKNTKYYDDKGGNGIREYYTIVRINKDGTKKILAENLITTDQTWVDEDLPANGDGTGYDVTYYVISNVCKVGDVGADGKIPQGAQVASVVTNTITLHIPGAQEYFDLNIAAGSVVTYEPTTVKPLQPNVSKNHFVNTVEGKPNANADGITLEPGDYIVLNRSIEGAPFEMVQRLNVKRIDNIIVAKILVYDIETVRNGQIEISKEQYARPNDITDRDRLIKESANYTDDFTAKAGSSQDAYYQLSLYKKNGSGPYHSNIVYVPSYKTTVSVVAKHRSGVPDAATCDPKEITHNEISFKPIINGNIEAYYIYRDTKPIARITQPTDATGTKYAVTLPDANGKFNIKADPINVDTETNQLTYTDLAASETPINETEESAVTVSRKDHFYTVVISLTDGKSTYGNNDVQPEYLGGLDELVVNAYCDEAEFGFWAWDGRFTSHLRWEKNWNEISDVELGKLLGYEIYYKEVNGKAYKRLTHETNFTEKTEKRNGKDVLVGYTTSKGKKIVLDANTTTFVDDYFWDGNGKTEWGMPGFITTPREYYVKAIFSKDQTVLKNIREKNSNRIKPDGNGVTTMVEGIEAPAEEITVYPNPATEYAVVRATNGINNVTVYNLTGAAVMNIAGNGESEMTLDVSALAAGTYFVAVNGEKPEKLIVR